MTRQEIFSIWAPEKSVWSPWAKPVLFAHIFSGTSDVEGPNALPDVTWAPGSSEQTAIVLDLPGDQGVWMGAALAMRGYRPVPLYNAVPLPFGDPPPNLPPSAQIATVHVTPILHALIGSAETLANIDLPSDAPPAFLLDANRNGEGLPVSSEMFDNRSVSFTTDFPSATFFGTHGIKRVILAQKDRSEPRPDLAHSLRRWQDAGLQLFLQRVDMPSEAVRIEIPRPRWYGAMFQRALACIGLRRSPSGGFGAWMPDSPTVG